ncbi:hypothetical protein M404DRAFT_152365, partial [Pisolithus tinctorius Marx 270]
TLLQYPTDSKKNGCPNCQEIMQAHPCRLPVHETSNILFLCLTPWDIPLLTFFFSLVSKAKYDVKVKGRIPEDVAAELESRGIEYRPSDQTNQD